MGYQGLVAITSHKKIFTCNIQTIMKLKKGFVLREVCGENVIMGEGLGAINFGKLIALNETAAWLWNQAQAMDDFTIEALAEKLCEEYEVTPDEARQDVADIIAEWREVNVVE
jgi:hypothetical protein